MRHNACNYQVKIVISWIKLFKLHSEVKTLCGDHHLFPLSFLISVPCLSGQEFLRNPELSPSGSHMHHASHNYLANTEKKLILCNVTSDIPVTLVTPRTPRKCKLKVESSKSHVAVGGLN